MVSLFDVNGRGAQQARIKLPQDARPPMLVNEEMHDKLLSYLKERLGRDMQQRNDRVRRFAKIDQTVSTWQQLSKADSERKLKQEATGQAQAIHMNLPIQQTHIDDLVSFLSSVYAPVSGSFYEDPTPNQEDAAARSVALQKMNDDAKMHKYYKELCLALRGLTKYNIGGFKVEWQPPSGSESKGSNKSDSIDMYNFFWDPSIDDPAEIPHCAEWAADVSRKNRMYLVRKEQEGIYYGVATVLDFADSGNGNIAEYYKYPPNDTGLTNSEDTRVSQSSRADWASYGVGLQGEGSTVLDHTHEVVEMYCWLNPQQFRLKIATDMTPLKNTYVLFKFTLLDGKRIVGAQMVTNPELEEEQGRPAIPYYVGFLNQDDMGLATRSIAELLAPFQSFGSFLLNSHISGTRQAIHGLQVYDPSVIDFSAVEPGQTAVRLPTKEPGRDVRSALQSVNGNATTDNTMNNLTAMLSVMNQFFPVQALPSQIAGMDRAVSGQVAAVLQGVNRRLHMLVRVLDSDVLGPSRFEQFQNLVRAGVDGITGLTNEEVFAMLGSGLAQLNREAAATAMQQLLFAILQNPKSAEQYDVIGIMNFWSKLLNLNTDLNQFKLQAPAATPEGAPPTQGAPAPAPVA